MSESAWADISKQHEQRKWGCISILLPLVLGEAGISDALGREEVALLSGTCSLSQHKLTQGWLKVVIISHTPDPLFLPGDPPVFDALVEGIRASSREEMPMAIASFQTAFPWYIQSLSHDQRGAEFTRVFKVTLDMVISFLSYHCIALRS